MNNIARLQTQSLNSSQNADQENTHQQYNKCFRCSRQYASGLLQHSWFKNGFGGAKKYYSESYLLELRDINLPLYDPSGPSSNDPSFNNSNNVLEKITTALKWADALVLASPDYHGSMSGTLKNFLDYFWEDFAGKHLDI